MSYSEFLGGGMAEESREASRDDFAEAGGGPAWAVLGAASREKADAYLDEQIVVARAQTEVLRLQAHELKDEVRLRHWSIRMRHVSDVMKVAFEFAVAVIFLGLVTVIASAVWNAAHDNGAVIEAFSVPPDLAARGITGEVVAAKVLDRLTAMQAETGSSRAASSYSSNWGDNIKVQIPDTGISIGEFNRYLHEWLGHETRITGQVYRTESGLAVSARASGAATPVFEGQDRELDALIDKAARAVYRITQPYRYAIYLMTHDKTRWNWTAEDTEADAVMKDLIASGSPEDRAWAYDGIGAHRHDFGDLKGATPMFRDAIAAGASLDAYADLAFNEDTLSHPAQELRTRLQEDATVSQGGEIGLDRSAAKVLILRNRRDLSVLKGDVIGASRYAAELHAVSTPALVLGYREDTIICALLHDAGCVNRVEAEHPVDPPSRREADILLLHYKSADDERAASRTWFNSRGSLGAALTPLFDIPGRARVAAGLGDFESARRLIAATPLDCNRCVEARAKIETLARNWDGAARWFAVSAAQAPEYPFTWSDWGEMLLHEGKYDAAIEKFREANLKGPHFADPLEMWGEALMQENRSDLALAKFEEANKYAPNWGRLHLEWGKALFYAGHRDETQKQFALSSTLDLSPSDRRGLEIWRTR